MRVLLHDPTGSLQPHRAEELVGALAEASGLPVGIYVQGAGGSALAATLAAARAGAQLIACAIYPLALVAPPRLRRGARPRRSPGWGSTPASTSPRSGAPATSSTSTSATSRWRRSRRAIAVRAAQHDVPASLVAGVDSTLRAQDAGDRLEEVLEELDQIRAETGWPPLAAPIGQVLASQALLNVLSASRYLTVVDELRALLSGHFGTPPGPIDPAVQRAVALTADPETEENVAPPLNELREQAEGMAASEEELLLLGLFGEDAENLLRADPQPRQRRPGRPRDDRGGARGADPRARPHRRGVRHRRDHDRGGRDARHRPHRRPTRRPASRAARRSRCPEPGPAPLSATTPNGFVRVEAPMVGTFYRAPQPDSPPFVEEGDVVAAGQTLCILEAMKLMNEVKAELEAIVRRVHVENAEPVEFGQVLFDLEPLTGRPLDAV